MDLHGLLVQIIPNLAAIIELIGVVVVVYGVIRSLYLFIFSGGNLMASDPKLDLAKALAYSLEFKLAAEILKSVVIQTLDEFIILAAIVVLRVILTFVIHWEIESSEKSDLVHRLDEVEGNEKKNAN
ncbi:DUF1622 domain-containing protein [Jeotgalibaca porci]|uniref:DUF1622 domain-containing protein n=1 Tax=Jeotgalibaca porci TaxID=1868793 RepID=A0A6G7WI97_9LACT|nr:DUF1622 domain-containing protein [Jeotgalibaca porci]NLB98962.1 DUF1622 domain-containing protein [Lactobacillales bacterium]QIK51946.1 DUF1622 domain-containing protein [Jeotgalibaca porci]